MHREPQACSRYSIIGQFHQTSLGYEHEKDVLHCDGEVDLQKGNITGTGAELRKAIRVLRY
jgi:hypothetical protein